MKTPNVVTTPGNLKELGVSLGVIFFLSIFIAYITQMIWPGDYYVHYVISLGYGISATICQFALPRIFGTNPNNLIIRGLSLFLALILGTLHAHWWISQFSSYFALKQYLNVFGIAVLFTLPVYYLFYIRDKNRQTQAKLKDAELKKTHIEKGLIHADLKRLQSQIEPHFLFNTLATIKAVVRDDPDLAEDLLGQLTNLLRTNLSKSRKDSISLQDELSSLESYLNIQKTRLRPRLSFDIEVHPDINQYQSIPPHLIQPLVENAIVHGIEPQLDGGHVKLNVQPSSAGWKIQVIDNGAGLTHQANLPQTKHSGIALENIRQRIKYLYDNRGKLVIQENSPSGVIATLELPCEH